MTLRYARLNSRIVLATGAEMNAVRVCGLFHFTEKIRLLLVRRDNELNARIGRQPVETRPDFLIQIDETDDASIDIFGEKRAQIVKGVETLRLRGNIGKHERIEPPDDSLFSVTFGESFERGKRAGNVGNMRLERRFGFSRVAVDRVME